MREPPPASAAGGSSPRAHPMSTTSLSTDPLPAQFQSHMATQMEALERRIRQLEQQAATGAKPAESLPDATKTLRDLFEYTVLRPVDLVRFDGDPYFMYVKDLAYTLFAEHMPETFLRNAQLTDADHAPPVPFAFSVSDFLEGRCPPFPRNEQWFKLVISAHLWHHGVHFSLFDIGANVGYSAVPCAKFAKRFGRTNRIYAFEPGMTGELLRANIDLNHVQDMVIPDSRAVSDQCGPVKMTSMLGYSVCDSISDFQKHYPQMVPAITRIAKRITIDEFVREKGIAEALVLKIDAEGHDWQVLRGARGCYARGQVAATIVEFVPHYLREFIDPGQFLVDLSQEHHLLSILELRKGYHWKGEALPDDPTALRAFAKQVAKSPLTYTDVIAISRRLPEARTLVGRLCAGG